jgi:tetratricopeptide (TPR) repeat protein
MPSLSACATVASAVPGSIPISYPALVTSRRESESTSRDTVSVRTFQSQGREGIILAAGPVLGAAVGAITNLITSTWNWWLFSLLLVLVSLAAGATVFASSRHPASTRAISSPHDAEVGVCTLPAGIAVFVDRHSELNRFSEDVKSRLGTPVVYAIIGSPGSGKTELATQAAHQLKKRFPDGQIFLNFRSHAGEASRMDAAALLANSLDIVSSDTSHNSFDASQLSSRWLKFTNGKRLLIILDDVEDMSQVAPLMPSSSGCAVIITSREEIPGIYPDIFIVLDGLSSEYGEKMITQIVSRASRTVDRDIIKSLAGMHHLPLTLRHVAAQLVAASNRSARMPQSDSSASPGPADTFRHTINSLTATQKLVFQRAALYPGPRLTVTIASALADVSADDAELALNALDSNGLIVTRDGYNYAFFHDLVRSVALEESRSRDTEESKTAARERLFELATRMLDQLNVLTSAPRLTRATDYSSGALVEAHDEFEAYKWFSSYFEDFRAITRLAINHEWSQAWRLTDGLAYFMRVRRNIPQGIDLLESTLQIALRAGDEQGQAVSGYQIGVLYRALSDYTRAEEFVTLAQVKFTEMNDLLGQARCHSELATITHFMARYPDSRDHTVRALALFEQLNDKLNVANCKGALGLVNRLLGNYESARTQLDQAFDLYLEIRNPRNQAWILIELGTIDRQTGKYSQARYRFDTALGLFDQTDDRSGHAWAERELGIVSRMTGDYSAAKAQLSDALAIFIAIGSKRNVADARIELGTLYRVTGELPNARDEINLALQIYEEIGNIRGAAWAGLECGALERLQGGTRAAEYIEKSLEIYEQIEDRSGLARSYMELGILSAESNDPQTARQRLSAALGLYEAMGSPESGAVREKLAAL